MRQPSVDGMPRADSADKLELSTERALSDPPGIILNGLPVNSTTYPALRNAPIRGHYHWTSGSTLRPRR
jgi:hypothetical protein